jgi:sulfatase modifying factor 1
MSTDALSRRDFIKTAGAAALAGTLGACTQPPPVTPPTPKQAAATKPPPTPTRVAITPLFPDMVLVEAGSFEMGSRLRPDEQPVHTVHITHPLYVARYAVTYEEYDLFCADVLGQRKPRDSGWGRGKLPVTNVDWYEAAAYCNWLSDKLGLAPCYSGKGIVTRCDFTAGGYRLPTEAEWEYAARGGPKSQGHLYAGSDNPDEVAWYADNSGDQLHAVGQKQPNELGLYDMSGNMYEWCWDFYGADYYASSPVDDPTGPPPTPERSPRGPNHVRRSSSWRENADSIRVAFRSFDYAAYPGDNGFRIVRTA